MIRVEKIRKEFGKNLERMQWHWMILICRLKTLHLLHC